MKGFIGFLVCLALIVLMLALGVSYTFMDVSSGTHTGYVTATEKAGWPWATYRVYFKTDVQSTQEDVYCVRDTEVYKQLEQFQRNKNLVTIGFENDEIFMRRWDCNAGESIVTSVNEEASS